MTQDTNHSSTQSSAMKLRTTCLSGLVLIGIFLWINLLSSDFEYGAQPGNSIIAVVALLMIAGPVSFIGLTSALKTETVQRRTLLMLILSFAISMRLVAVFTCPILEIDYYRYLWDGKVAAAGFSPYGVAPSEILNSSSMSNERLDHLKSLSLETESNHTILSRVHFEGYTTIYPPVGQLVFAAVMSWLPQSASVEAHILAMRLSLMVFDIGTMVLILSLLNQLQIKAGWLIIYGWNPLIVKEIANSGHLDSVATFLLMLSIVLLVKWHSSVQLGTKTTTLVGSAFALGFAVGAKLFPVVAFPAMAIFIVRRSFKQFATFSFVFAIVTVCSLMPMTFPGLANRITQPQPLGVQNPTRHGTAGFFSQWRMNDTFFSFVYLNLKDSKRNADEAPWFVVSSADFRGEFEHWFRRNLKHVSNPGFVTARILTLTIFCLVYLWQMLAFLRQKFNQQADHAECHQLLKRMSTILFAFLMLQPTVNTWYFIWVLPFSCFSLNRGWLVVSGLLMSYYSRFWFQIIAEEAFIGHYSGVEVYDHIVVWIVMILSLGVLLYFSSSNSVGDSPGVAQAGVDANPKFG